MFKYIYTHIYLKCIVIDDICSGTSNTPYQTTYTNGTGAHSNKSRINNLLNNDHILRIKQLESELVEARTKTHVC